MGWILTDIWCWVSHCKNVYMGIRTCIIFVILVLSIILQSKREDDFFNKKYKKQMNIVAHKCRGKFFENQKYDHYNEFSLYFEWWHSSSIIS